MIFSSKIYSSIDEVPFTDIFEQVEKPSYNEYYMVTEPDIDNETAFYIPNNNSQFILTEDKKGKTSNLRHFIYKREGKSRVQTIFLEISLYNNQLNITNNGGEVWNYINYKKDDLPDLDTERFYSIGW